MAFGLCQPRRKPSALADGALLDELKLPFICVPHDAPEPIEWMISHLDWIKLPATLEPDAHRDDRANRSSGRPPPGQRRTLD
jgi:hypothetical protein